MSNAGHMTTWDASESDEASADHNFSMVIAHHPDLRRVGEVCSWRALEQKEGTTLSRVDPLFTRGDMLSRPLGDPRLSRTPLRIHFDGAHLCFSSESNSYRVEGRPVSDVLRIPAHRSWQEGLLIELGDYASVVLRRSLYAAPAPTDSPLIGVSDAICHARALLGSMGTQEGPIVLQGEFGVGRTHLARALHDARETDLPLVVTDLTGLDAPSTQAALGADRMPPPGSTILLSRVDGLSPEACPALERFLRLAAEQQTVVIATTHNDLKDQVENGRMPAQLRHQLSAVHLVMPPLRERREDIAPLFLAAIRRRLRAMGAEGRLDTPQMGESSWLPQSATRALLSHRWPGNTTELISVASRVALESQARRVAVLPELAVTTSPATRPRRVALAVDRVKTVLRHNQWNIRQTAKDLGVARNTLISFMDRSPAFRRGKDLSDTELHRVIAIYGPDPVTLADALGVSPQGIRLRLAKLDR